MPIKKLKSYPKTDALVMELTPKEEMASKFLIYLAEIPLTSCMYENMQQVKIGREMP